MTNSNENTTPPQSRTDELRQIDDMHLPDFRQTCYVKWGPLDSELVPITLQDHHDGPAHFPLPDYIPEDVRNHWDTARNLWLYAWNVWRFYPLSQFQAMGTLELALRIKLFGKQASECKLGLDALLKKSIKQKLWDKEDIKHIVKSKQHHINGQHDNAKLYDDPLPNETDIENFLNEHFQVLLRLNRMIRNHVAHGETFLDNKPHLTFEFCHDIICTIFKK